MRTITICLAGLFILALAAQFASAATITLWNFQDARGNGTLVPDLGTGTVSLVNCSSTGFLFGSGSSEGSSSDTFKGGNGNKAYSTTGYAAQGAGNKTSGIQFNVNTTGYKDVRVQWDTLKYNTASRYTRFQYTTDGSIWTDGALFSTTVPSWQVGQAVDLSAIQAAWNNPLFGFRLVAEFEPGKTSYTATTSGSKYYTTGVTCYDMVKVSGTAIPEPSSLIALATGLIGIMGVVARRRG